MEEIVGYINITVGETDISYDTDLREPEVIFWLEMLKSIVLKNLLTESESE